MMVVPVDAQPMESNLHGILADKRDGVIADTAKLVTGLGEECKAELDAAAGGKSGAAFGLLLQQLNQRSMASLQANGQRAAMVLAFDLMKKLDSSVALDLFGPNPATSASASSSSLGSAKPPDLPPKPNP
jgi:hypothetical protein